MRALALAVTLGLTSIAGSLAPAAASADEPSACFLSSQWSGWRATPDAKTIYIGVGMNRIYRLDLASDCPMLRQVGVHLVTKLTGPWICHPLDLDLHVSDGHPSACIVRKITPLTPEEAAALPKDLRP